MEPYKPLETGPGRRLCVYVCVYARPRLHYRLLTLCPAPTDPVPRGQLWPTGSVGAGQGSVGDSVGEGTQVF